MRLGKYGYVRVAAAVPDVMVGDTAHNAGEIADLIRNGADRHKIKVMVFPELSLTGYTCGDLFHQENLLAAAQKALEELLDRSYSTVRWYSMAEKCWASFRKRFCPTTMSFTKKGGFPPPYPGPATPFVYWAERSPSAKNFFFGAKAPLYVSEWRSARLPQRI